MDTQAANQQAANGGSGGAPRRASRHGETHGATVSPAREGAPFNLSRRFALLALLVITAVSAVTSAALMRFLASEMLQRDAEVSRQFILQSVIGRNAVAYFTHHGRDAARDKEVETYFHDLMGMPDLLRAQMYSASGERIWASDPVAPAESGPNPELVRALAGELVVEADLLESRDYVKPEHAFARESNQQFAEYYIPVRAQPSGEVIGVVELYKRPDALFESIRAGLRLVWLCALGGGLFMYAVLFWVVRRGQSIIRAQQRRIVSNEGFAAVGEIAASVAHNIRNPLAAIRSSAELLEGSSPEEAARFTGDIISQADRIESWVHGLLGQARAGVGGQGSSSANEVLRAALDELRGDCERQGVRVLWQLAPGLPPAAADADLLRQVLNTIATNALQAMPEGGTLALSTRAASLPRGRRMLEISLTDSGVGIPAHQLRRAFTDPRSTKPNGMGIGLPLVARTLERLGGAISVSSTQGQGTRVCLSLPVSA